MALILLLIIFILIIATMYYATLFAIKYVQLRRDYRHISFLPISNIPLIGNTHQLDKQQYLFSRLLMRLSEEARRKNKGLFCLWYSLWPMVFACTGKSLEGFINNSKQQVKGFEYTLLEPWLKTGLLTSNRAKWKNRRRLITPSYHDVQLLNNFMIIFNEQSRIFSQRIDRIIRMTNNAETVDLYPLISACTLDIISEAAMGVNVQAQTTDGKNEFVEATGRMGYIISNRSRTPWLWPSFIFNRVPLGREQARNLQILHSTSRKIIEERLASFKIENSMEYDGKRRRVFLDSLLSQMYLEKLSLDDIQEEVDTFMFEGHDTTAAAINFTLYLVGSHLDIQNQIQIEIDEIFSDDINRPCTIEDTQRMVYLDAVIKESMRIMPPVPLITREIQEDLYCGGQIIRKGTGVYILIMAIHYDAEMFPEPEKFDPNRFLHKSTTNHDHSPYAFIPFSAGSRNCIGQRFALLEEKVILSTLFRHFSFRSTQTIDDLRLSFEAIMRPTNPIQMIVKHR